MDMMPPEVVFKFQQYLTWQDNAQARVTCRKWAQAYQQHYATEWQLTQATASSPQKILTQLPDLTCFYGCFPPNLAIVYLSVGSADTRTFRRGKWWKEFEQVVRQRRLLPDDCLILCYFAPQGISGYDGREEMAFEYHVQTVNPDEAVSISVAVAHLPGAKLQALGFNRKEINGFHKIYTSILEHSKQEGKYKDHQLFVQDSRRVDTSKIKTKSMSLASPLDFSPNTFIVASSSFSCSKKLIDLLSYWEPNATIHGGLFPYSDQVEPTAFRCPVGSNGTLECHKNIILALGGSFDAIPIASHGYEPCSGVLQCGGVEAIYSGEQTYFMYENVVLNETNLSPSAAIQTYQAGVSISDIQPLYVISSDSPETLQKVEEFEKLDPSSIIPIYCSDVSSVVCSSPQCWHRGKWGRFVTLGAVPAVYDLAQSIKSAQRSLNGRKPVAAFLFTNASRCEHFYQEAAAEAKLLHRDIPGIPITGCFTEGEIGPRVNPGGFLSDREIKIEYDVLGYTTSGLIIVEKK